MNTPGLFWFFLFEKIFKFLCLFLMFFVAVILHPTKHQFWLFQCNRSKVRLPAYHSTVSFQLIYLHGKYILTIRNFLASVLCTRDLLPINFISLTLKNKLVFSFNAVPFLSLYLITLPFYPHNMRRVASSRACGFFDFLLGFCLW